jgi:hypothetical protein
VVPTPSPHTTMILVVQAVLVILAAAAGAFFGEYFRTRGKNLATKADFDSLRDQLRANTELTETIKTEISHEDWAKREWTNLRRVKLEELLQKRLECHEFLTRLLHASIEARLFTEANPIFAFESILILYFAELEEAGRRFMSCFNTLRAREYEHNTTHSIPGVDAAFKTLAATKLAMNFEKDIGDFQRSSDELARAARPLLLEIMSAQSDRGSAGSPKQK